MDDDNSHMGFLSPHLDSSVWVRRNLEIWRKRPGAPGGIGTVPIRHLPIPPPHSDSAVLPLPRKLLSLVRSTASWIRQMNKKALETMV